MKEGTQTMKNRENPKLNFFCGYTEHHNLLYVPTTIELSVYF